MTKQSKEVERYLKAVGKQLRVAKKERRNFLEGYRSYIWDYIEEDGQPFDYNKLVRFFGTPTAVAENYVWAGNGQAGVVGHKYMQYALYGIVGVTLTLCVFVLLYILSGLLITTPATFFTGNMEPFY